ncbi:hypoxanthine phosphoribosyltransferase [Peptoniphilus sp. AGMB00490]|uniref:Hypoxanthine phosphoribosyltransferase n=2 Tax=Peptoniphilus TaxID=162289 RepID=A0ACD6AZZ7_9FIRM|nr:MULTISPECIES: hypoxanthine phosphoribosyltransferase [Peptoniphilus]NMW84945.1 hypoxanthine phosphoribosyltransferase [Peptoniphilus faecalis]OLR65494.1 hypoxanthine phosphoribosyltransferase [Peptoniphilus porci]
MERQILFSRDEIREKVENLGKKISADFDDDFVVISLLRGSFIFAADLVREIDKLVEIDFLTTSSYGHNESSSGEVRFLTDLRTNIENRNVLVVDDILDTGNTLYAVKEKLLTYNPKKLKTCVLLDKPSRREADVSADYVGFEIEDIFIVGYGLNYGDYYRNVPYIYTYKEKNEEF